MSQADIEWDKMTMIQLRPFLLKRGLRVSGKKADRVDDIIKYEEKQHEKEKRQKEQHQQQHLASENDSFTQYISKVNDALGYDGIDSDTVEHLTDQNVNSAMFKDYVIR
eukprot:888748_1